jgi:putative tryptophan/tyrosine transport system substrate-binding protein
MKRRELIKLLGGGMVAWPLVAQAQLRLPLIGWLGIGDADSGAVFLAGFLKGMTKLGYVEGRDFTMATRWAGGANERLSFLTAELLALQPAIIVAEGTRGAEISAQATSTIPIVVISLAELTAVKLGGANFAHPVANVTGVLTSPRNVTSKLLEIMVDAIPGITRCGLFIDAVMFDLQMERAQAAATALHIDLKTSVVAKRDDLESGLMKLKEEGAQVVIAPSSAMFRAERQRVVSLMAAAGMPAIYDNKILVDAGGLMAYGVDTVSSFERSADLVVRILRGTRVGDVPIEQPNPTFSINLKTAKALGLVIPPTLIFRADEVIE